SRHRLRRRGDRPRHRHRPRGRQRHHRHGPSARVGRRRPHDHVPGHRLHRGTGAVRLRPRVHHLRLNADPGTRRATVRIRTPELLAASGVAVAATFALALPAGAAEQPKFANKAAKECSEKLANGGTIDDCQKAPSPLKPENNEVIWGSLSFLVLLVAMWKW